MGIIFCDMDGLHTDVIPKEKKFWYRKFSSFNYAWRRVIMSIF